MGVLKGKEVSVEDLLGYNKLQELLALIISHLNDQDDAVLQLRADSDTRRAEADELRRQSAEALGRAEALGLAAAERAEAAVRAAAEGSEAAAARAEALERAAEERAEELSRAVAEVGGGAAAGGAAAVAGELAGDALERFVALEARVEALEARAEATEARAEATEAADLAQQERLESTTLMLRDARLAASKESRRADAELRAAIDALPPRWAEEVDAAVAAVRDEAALEREKLASRLSQLDEQGAGVLAAMSGLETTVSEMDQATLKTRRELLAACDEARSQCLKIAEAAGDLKERMSMLEHSARGGGRGGGDPDDLSAACDSVGRLEGEVGALQSKMEALTEKEVVDVQALGHLITEIRKQLTSMRDKRAAATTRCLSCHLPRQQAAPEERTVMGYDGKVYRRGRTAGGGPECVEPRPLPQGGPGGFICAQGLSLHRPVSAPGLRHLGPAHRPHSGAAASLRRHRSRQAIEACAGPAGHGYLLPPTARALA